MNERILIPLDGSPLAEAILPQAVAIARLRGYAVTLLHVVGPSRFDRMYPLGGSAVPETLEEHHVMAAAYLHPVHDRLVAQGMAVNLVVDEGDPAMVIRHHADDNRVVRMVAMATHGRGGLHRWLLGSVSDTVFRSVHKPILLVRPTTVAPTAEVPRLRTILVPLDGSAIAAQALVQAQILAEESGARLVLLGVIPELSDGIFGSTARPQWVARYLVDEEQAIGRYLDTVAAQVSVTMPQISTIVAHGEAAAQICQAADAELADLIVMASHGRGGFQRLWHGSVTTKVAQRAHVPLLAINAALTDAPGTPL